jgi:methylated-DNA-protein-cysteine methyltransferase-like protein
MEESFTKRVIAVLKGIPEGQVTTYGIVAALAGNPRAARQVVRILHSMSKKYNLPWHRVINSKGFIAINDPSGFDEQRILLSLEGVYSDKEGKVNVERFWAGQDDKIFNRG